MTIKYLAGNRIQGTSHDRFAITGKAFGPETYSGGGSAQAINFNGSSDYMVIGSRTDFKFLHDGSSWSIRIRVLPDSQSGGFTILNTSGDGGNDIGIQVQATGSSGQIRVRFGHGSGQIVTNTIDSALTNDSWTDFVATYNGTNLILYYNGANADTASNTSTTYSTEPSKTSLALGVRSNDFGYYFMDGKLDDLGIWKDRVLTPAEITALYNSGTLKECSFIPRNLRLFLNFNTPANHGAPNENWLKNKAPVFLDGTIFEETDTHKSYIYDSDSGTTNTAKDFWTEIT